MSRNISNLSYAQVSIVSYLCLLSNPSTLISPPWLFNHYPNLALFKG